MAETVQLNFYAPRELRDAAAADAAANDLNLSQWLRSAMREKLERSQAATR